MPAADNTPNGAVPVTEEDHRLAAELATRTGALLMGLLERHRVEAANPRHGLDELRAEGDRTAQEFLAAALAEARPGDAVLSEEAPDDLRRLQCRRVWIIDPLDGTRQYGEPGRADWGVHVALAVDGEPVVGAVALPAEGVTLSTAEPPSLPPLPQPPAPLLQQPPQPSQPSQPPQPPLPPATGRGRGQPGAGG